MNAPIVPRSPPASMAPVRVVGTQRDGVRTTAYVLPELERAVELSTIAVGVVDGSEELFEAHSQYAEASALAPSRPRLDPERVIDSALLRDFAASRVEVERADERVREARERRQEAERAAGAAKVPFRGWLTVIVAGVATLGVVSWWSAAGFMALGLHEFILAPALAHFAPGLAYVVAAIFALFVTGSIVGSLVAATCLSLGRVSTEAKLGFVVLDAVYAASFLAVRIGQGETNWAAQIAWSGLELTPILFCAVTLSAVGPVLRRSVKRRGAHGRLLARVAQLRDEEAAEVVHLRTLEARAAAVAEVVQEREEAERDERALVELAKKTSDLAVLRGLARNREKADGGMP